MSHSLNTAIQQIDQAVPDARNGLTEPIFYMVSRLTPLVNVDLLIRDSEGRFLLTWRVDQFHGSGWHVPGGIIRYKETWEQRIAAVAANELHTTVSFDPTPMTIRQPIHPDRAIRGHFISLLFRCVLTSPLNDMYKAGDIPENGQWAWIMGCPDNLIPVHQRIYGDLLRSGNDAAG